MSPPSSSGALAARALRCPQWVHFLALPAAGVAPGRLRGALGALALATIAAAGALAWAYGLNAVADRATDPARKNPLAGAPSVHRATWAILGAAAAVALAASAALGLAAALAAGLSLAAGAIYSVGPRAKGRPFTGVAANTLIFLPLGTLPVGVTGARPALALLLATFAALLVQNQLVHELADAAEDARSGDRTTAIALGSVGTRWVIGAVTGAGAALVWALSPGPGSVLLGTALVLAGAAVALGDAPAAARRRHRWLALAGGALLWLVAP